MSVLSGHLNLTYHIHKPDKVKPDDRTAGVLPLRVSGLQPIETSYLSWCTQIETNEGEYRWLEEIEPVYQNMSKL